MYRFEKPDERITVHIHKGAGEGRGYVVAEIPIRDYCLDVFLLLEASI